MLPKCPKLAPYGPTALNKNSKVYVQPSASKLGSMDVPQCDLCVEQNRARTKTRLFTADSLLIHLNNETNTTRTHAADTQWLRAKALRFLRW
jgi:hypothetical protein